jgi:hypothetical protein
MGRGKCHHQAGCVAFVASLGCLRPVPRLRQLNLTNCFLLVSYKSIEYQKPET